MSAKKIITNALFIFSSISVLSSFLQDDPDYTKGTARIQPQTVDALYAQNLSEDLRWPEIKLAIGSLLKLEEFIFAQAFQVMDGCCMYAVIIIVAAR